MLLCYRHIEKCKPASERPQSASCKIVCLRSLYISAKAMLLLARPVVPSVRVLDKASRVRRHFVTAALLEKNSHSGRVHRSLQGTTYPTESTAYFHISAYSALHIEVSPVAFSTLILPASTFSPLTYVLHAPPISPSLILLSYACLGDM